MLHLEHSFIWCWNLNASGSRSETPGKFWNVVLEKDGKDQLDRACEKWRSIRVKEQRNILQEISKRKANWIGHILRRNCLLQRVNEGKIKGGLEVTGRRGRRRRKLLDDLKERSGCCHLKEKALGRTMWRALFGRGFVPVVRQTTNWMNEYDSTNVPCPRIYLSPTLNKLLNFWWNFASTPRVWRDQEHLYLYLYLLPGCVAGLSAIHSNQSTRSQILRIICTWLGLLGLSIH